MRPVELPPHDTEMADAYDALLEKGDYVTIYPISGQPISMEVVAVTDESIHGKTRTLSEVTIPGGGQDCGVGIPHRGPTIAALGLCHGCVVTPPVRCAPAGR